MASAIWQTGLKDGTGFISTESGLLKEEPYAVDAGFEGLSVTNPDELIAAALSSSFILALSAELDKVYLIPEKIRAAAGVRTGHFENGWTITQIHLELRVQLIKDDLVKFEAATKAALDRCILAQLPNAKITLDAKLESWRSFGEIKRKKGSIPLGKQLVSLSLPKYKSVRQHNHKGV